MQLNASFWDMAPLRYVVASEVSRERSGLIFKVQMFNNESLLLNRTYVLFCSSVIVPSVANKANLMHNFS